MALAWFIAFVILLVIELVTADLVTIWFVVGTIGAIVASTMTNSFLIQAIVFIILSVLSFFIAKLFMKEKSTLEITSTNYDRIVGKVGEVTKEVKMDKYGEIRVAGDYWSAKCDKPLKVGDRVEVLAVDTVLKVKRRED